MFNTDTVIFESDNEKDIIRKYLSPEWYLSKSDYEKIYKESWKKRRENALSSLKELDETLNTIESRSNKMHLEQLSSLFYVKMPQTIATLKYNEYIQEDALNKSEIKDKDEEKKKALSGLQTGLEKNINNVLSGVDNKYDDFTKYYKSVINNDVPSIDVIKKTIKSKSDELFSKLKEQREKLINLLQLEYQKTVDSILNAYDIKALQENISRQIAEVPLLIEDTIKQIKLTLDTLLGKGIGTVLDPSSMDFDLQTIVNNLLLALTPLLTAIQPLESVGGNIPVLGDLTGVLTKLGSTANGSKLSKEDIKKLIGDNKPAIPSSLEKAATDTYEDVKTAISILPIMLINVIFAMIDVIYSKLKIITSVIPLGGMFPLTLIDSAISAGKSIIDFSCVGGAMFKDIVMGAIYDKYAEIAALSIPTEPPELPTFSDPTPDKLVDVSKPPTPPQTFDGVILKFLVENKENNKLNRFTRSDLIRIKNSFCQIYNGSNEKLNKYIVLNKQCVVEKDAIVREEAEVMKFQEYINNIFKNIDEENRVKVLELVDVDSLLASYLPIFETYIKDKEPNRFIVIEVSLEPSRIGILGF